MAKVAARASMLPEQTIVIALGDNIYYEGFPRKEAGQQEWTDDQLESISYLDAQLKVAEVSGASLYLVPGNHDWFWHRDHHEFGVVIVGHTKTITE